MLEINQIVEVLGLGSAGSQIKNLKPGDVNPVFAVDTERGPWVIKTARPSGSWWLDRARRAAIVEQAALDAGVAMPAVVPPAAGRRVGMWTPVGDGAYARALVRITGSHPPADPLVPSVARWVGATLAAIESVAPPVAGTWEETGYGTYSADEWADWLDEARVLDVLSAVEAASAADLVADLNDRIEAGIKGCPGLKVLHRDVSRVNILLTADGPQLLDFDCAGPQAPWWEAVGHFFALASPELGVVEPERRTVDATLQGYRDAGGGAGPAAAEAFTGRLAAELSNTAFLLWNACGHRGGDATWHQRCAAAMRKSLSTLDPIAASAERWSTWLR